MMIAFGKILIGIDFSDASLAAARWAATHLAPDGELLLVHVVPLPRQPLYLHDRLATTVDQSSASTTRLYTALQGFADLLGSVRVRVGVRIGVPWSALARVGGEVKADLICVGRGQKRKGSNRFGATTPQRLLGISRIPVLVIPQGVTARPSRVLAALSARPGGERVLQAASRLAKSWESRLEVVHIIEPEVATVSSGSQVVEVPTLASEWAAAAISGAAETDSTKPVIRTGDAGQELITVASEQPGTSVVVMGRTGESISIPPSLTHFRSGSTTRMVLWAAPGPVLVVPLESTESYVLPFETPIRGLDTRLRSQSTIARLSALPSPGRWNPDGNGAA